MSAPEIPNLSTLRRGGLRLRGKGRGDSRTTVNEHGATQHSLAKDEVIQNTDTDAATSRLSAVEAGYLDDPFARLLTPGQHARRLPLMNRGTYARTIAIDLIVDTFLDSCQQSARKKQVISLGAGSDTRFFRLKQKYPLLDLVYHELDFTANTKAKIALLKSSVFIEKAKKLSNFDISGPEVFITDDGALSSPTYYIHPQDLRQLQANKPLTGVDATVATLLISECCLIYLSPVEADAVLGYFTTLFSSEVPLAIAIYEPIRPNDAFGRTMVSNLTARGIYLQTLEKYASLAAQRDRLRRFGFSGGAEAADIDFIWRKWQEEKERERAESLEWMDEVEEFTLFARHYCVAWGWRSFPRDQGWARLLSAQNDD